MKPVLIGLVVGVFVFFGLLLALGAGTGPVELVLWLVVAVGAGWLAARLTRRGTRAGTRQP